jgi:nucleoporin SEH1
MKPPASKNHGFTSIDQAAADVVLSATFSPSGNRIALASADHRIRVYDAGLDNSWNLVDQWRGHDAEVLDASLLSGLRTLLMLMPFCKG